MNMEERGKYDFNFAGRTILVVEDNQMSAKLIRSVLVRVNAGFLHAPNGFIAIEYCREKPGISMVVMDLQMPGMSGIEATREIKKIRPELPVIIATANTFDHDESSCREAGCDHFIHKPLKFRKLFEFMEAYFAQNSNE